MSKNNNYTIPLVLAGIGLLILSKKSNVKPTKEFIGEYGYSEIEIWTVTNELLQQHSNGYRSYNFGETLKRLKGASKEFLTVIDRIRKRFGFQELGEIFTETRIQYNSFTKRKEKRIYLINSIKDDQLDGERLKKLWLNEIFKLYPVSKYKYRNKEFGIRIIKNTLD